MAELWATVDDPGAFIEADLAFHRAVFVAATTTCCSTSTTWSASPLEAIRPLHTRSVGHNTNTLPNHEQVAVAIGRGHHRKAEQAMRDVVEAARADVQHEVESGRRCRR